MVDAALDAAQDEISSKLAEVESRELANIEVALERMRGGKYGLCEICNGKIPLARLNALPYATSCIECQRATENAGAGGGYAGDWSRVLDGGDGRRRHLVQRSRSVLSFGELRQRFRAAAALSDYNRRAFRRAALVARRRDSLPLESFVHAAGSACDASLVSSRYCARCLSRYCWLARPRSTASRPAGRRTPVSFGPTDRDRLYDELHRDVAAMDRELSIYKRVVQLVAPSVVHVQAKPLADYRFGRDVEEAGSGVVVRMGERDYVLTNRHVVKHSDPEHIRLELSDGRQISPTQHRSATPKPTSPCWSSTSPDLVPARIGDSDDVEIGDVVMAFGNPFNLRQSVTRGIISGKGRVEPRPGRRRRRLPELHADRRRHQPRQQRRAAGEPSRRGDRPEHGHRQQLRRQRRHRLLDPHQHRRQRHAAAGRDGPRRVRLPRRHARRLLRRPRRAIRRPAAADGHAREERDRPARPPRWPGCRSTTSSCASTARRSKTTSTSSAWSSSRTSAGRSRWRCFATGQYVTVQALIGRLEDFVDAGRAGDAESLSARAI